MNAALECGEVIGWSIQKYYDEIFHGDRSEARPVRGPGHRAVGASAPVLAASLAKYERRPITVMFCDLVGSTSLAAKLDAEDWRNLVNAYLDEASAAVTDFGGHVLKKLGDGLMALFGYPQAQENDAERAVRAALAVHALIQDAAYESLLKSRRQALHRRAAEILRDQSEHAAEPEAIAHHSGRP